MARAEPPVHCAGNAARIAASLVVLLLALSGGLLPATAGAERLTLACGRFPAEHQLCLEAASEWAEANGHEVRLLTPPESPGERLAVFEELLGVRASALDVLEIDVVWPGILAEHLADLSPPLGDEARAFFPSLIANATVQGRLVALPWFLELGLLYYRRDLLTASGLDVPETWRELEDAAAVLQDTRRALGDDRFWGFIWQGWTFEGLTCNALEWLAGWGGGRIVDADGGVTVDNPHAEHALERAADWIGIISPESVLTHTETETLAQFAQGRAAFMRHWPYAWTQLNAEDSPLRGKVGVALLPRGGPGNPHPATLGGWQLAVSRYSEHPELAADLVRHLTSAGVLRSRAHSGGYIPTRPALLHEPALLDGPTLLDAQPHLKLLRNPDLELVARPSAVTRSQYPAVSAGFQQAVFGVLDQQLEAASALGALATQLNLQSDGGSDW